MDSILPDLWQSLSTDPPVQQTLDGAADSCVPTVFGVRLRRTTPVLGRLGIGMTIRHTENDEMVSLEQLAKLDGLTTNPEADDKWPLSSASSSGVNPRVDNHLRKADDTDDKNRPRA